MRLWLAALLLSLTASSARAQAEAPAQDGAPVEDMSPPAAEASEEAAPPAEDAPPADADETTVDGEGAQADVSVDSAADGVKPQQAKSVSKPSGKKAAKTLPKSVAPKKPVLPPEPAAPLFPAVPLTPPTPYNP